jgi:hypothetical protein
MPFSPPPQRTLNFATHGTPLTAAAMDDSDNDEEMAQDSTPSPPTLRLSKGQKKAKKAKKAKVAAGKAGSNTKPPTVTTADVTSCVEMQGALLQLLVRTTGEKLRTTQQQNAAKSLKPIHNITATSSIFQIIATF